MINQTLVYFCYYYFAAPALSMARRSARKTILFN